MDSLKAFVERTKRRCSLLYDRDKFKGELLLPLKEQLPHLAGGVTGAACDGFDTRPVHYGCPPELLTEYTTFAPERFASHFIDGLSRGYSTVASHQHGGLTERSDIYKTLFEPHGFRHGLQTFFFDESGGFFGAYGIARRSDRRFSGAEIKLFNRISPYVFSAFVKYRWLVEAGFFTTTIDDLIFAVVMCDTRGRVTWTNRVAKKVLGISHNDDLPGELRSAVDGLKKIYSKKPSPMTFRDWKAGTALGTTLAFRVDDSHVDLLPASGDGFILFIDHRERPATGRRLGRREREVLKGIARGMSDREVATAMGISERTVHNHVNNIFRKLGASNRTEAAVKAVRTGLV